VTPGSSAAGLRLALISRDPDRLSGFAEALRACGFRVAVFRDVWGFQQADPALGWLAVVLHGQGSGFRDSVEHLITSDPFLPVAVASGMEAEAFHEASEGLGLLEPLPEHPGAEAVESFLEGLRGIGRLDPRIEAAQARLDAMAQRHHPHCVVCWERHPFGLKVDYLATGADTVEGHFGCGASYEGYRGVLHGGVVSSLLDGAMAACILARGVEAYTVDLRIRFRHAVDVGLPALIRGTWAEGEGPIHHLTATLEQGGKVRATARAKFFEGSPDQPSQPMPGGAGVRNLLRQARKRPL